MKKHFIFSVVILCIASFTFTTGAQDIILKKKKGDTGTTRSIQIFPVSAELTPNTLEIVFVNNVGLATIQVENQDGNIVAFETANTTDENERNLSIPTSTWNQGEYFITIEYGTTMLEGEFSLE